MKISIVTVTFNSSSTLRDTFQSILNQTYFDFEYLVIDGASTDNTLEIIKEYEPKFEGKMRYISEPDKGIYAAMNKGINMATGDVVGILNSDDFYTSNDALACLAHHLQQDHVDAIYGDVHYVKDERLDKCVRYYSSAKFRRSWMRFGFMPAHPSFYCYRSVYEKYGSFDTSYRVAADFENLLRFVFIHRIRTKYIPKDFVTMRTGGASSSGIQSHRQIMRDHLRALRANGIYSNIALLSLRYIYKIIEINIIHHKIKK